MVKRSGDGYKSIRLPEELVKEIDNIIILNKIGFRSRAEFVKEAVRILLLTFDDK